MKKLLYSSIIIVSVGIAMIIIGSILNGINWQTTDFDGTSFAGALSSVGYIIATLSGVVLAGCGISFVLRQNDCEKDKEKKDKE